MSGDYIVRGCREPVTALKALVRYRMALKGDSNCAPKVIKYYDILYKVWRTKIGNFVITEIVK